MTMTVRLSLFAASSLLALCPVVAMAAEAPVQTSPAAPAAPADAAAPAVPGDIVVTAQRRNESLQKTPLAISAFTGSTLAARGVISAAGLQAQVPGLVIAPQVWGNLQIFLRGVGSTANTQQGDPAIAFNVDGVYVARTNSTSGVLFDLERIEVLKGPQGTLYGRNATGGAVNVITVKPTFDRLKGYETVDFGNYGSIQTEGALNVPLSDTLAARVSYKTARHDGYLKAVAGPLGTVGNDRQDQDDAAARAEVLWKPTEKLSLLASADVSHQGGAGGGEVLLPNNTGNPWTTKVTQKVAQDNHFANGSLTGDYDLGFAKLTYVGAFRYSHVNRSYEYPLTNNPGYINTVNREWTHELRLGGTTGRLTWLVGGYLFRERTMGGGPNGQSLRLQLTSTLWQAGYVNPFTSTSEAEFGQATYALTDKLRITGGIRHTHDHKWQTGQTQLQTAAGSTISVSSLDNSDGQWSATNWKAGMEYDVAPHSMFYFNASTAYKAGGSFGGTAPNLYDPEHLTAYEVGLKNRFFDNRLTLNLAAYKYDYTNLQVTSLQVDSNGTTRTVTLNAGTANIKGIEAEAAYVSQNYGKFDASLAYTDARYGTFTLPYGDSYTNYGLTTHNAVSYSGNAMPLTAKWSFNLGYEYSHPFAKGTLTGRAQTHYESGKFMDFHDYSVDYQKAYTKTDLTLTYQPDAWRWSLQAYVRNLENRAVLGTAIPPQGGSPAYAQAFYLAPRTYGARLTYTF
jgi:iron complex outermembrane receptor protein